MAAFNTPVRKKSVYARGTVTCRKCGSAIHIYKLRPLPDEFSVRCARCSERGHYIKRDVAVQELPERRRKPRD